MKHTVVVLGLATILLAGGCTKEEKLTCTKEVKDVNYVQEQKMEINVKNEKVSKMILSSDIEYDKASDKDIQTAYDMVKNVYTNLEGDGIDVDVTKAKKSVKAVINIDFDKASEENIKQFSSAYTDGKNEKIKISDIKKDLEEDEYTCK